MDMNTYVEGICEELEEDQQKKKRKTAVMES
jgi:hypothetical protein